MDLLNFLAQSAGLLPANVAQDDQVPVNPNEGEDITVTGTRPNNDPKVFDMSPQPRIWREQEKPQGAEFGMELGAGRKSPMGVGGKLRDILGGLGDALLVGQGGEALYAKKRQEEKMQDAMAIYDQDPVAGMQAIRSIDTKRAYDMSQDSIANRLEQDKVRRQIYDTEIKKLGDGLKGWQTIGNTANGITDERSYQLMKPMLEKIITDYDLPLTLPANFDKATIDALIKSQLGAWRDQRLSQMERNLNSTVSTRAARVSQGEQRLEQGRQNLGLKERSVRVQEAREARQGAEDDGLGGRPAAATAGSYTRTATFGGKRYGLPKDKTGEKRSDWVELPNQ